MPQTRKPRLYSLFHKIGGKYVRQSALAFRKPAAVRVFQSALLAGCFAGNGACLRVVKSELAPENPPPGSDFRPAAIVRQNRANAADSR